LSDSARAGTLATPQIVSSSVIRTQRKLRMAILVSFIVQSHSGDGATMHLKAARCPR
jgi:hypothetical protein